MRASSSEASGSSISSRRGLASSARPIATRCFSPPESVAGPAVEQVRRCRAGRRRGRRSPAALGRRREPAAIEQVLPHAQMREEPRPPGRRSRCGAGASARTMPAAVSTSTPPSTTIRPRPGAISPAITLTSVVLPEPERAEQRRHGRPALSKRASRSKSPSRCWMSTSMVIRLEPSAGHAPRQHFRGEQRGHRDGDRDQRQPHARRASPPGTWVKV